MNIVIGLSGKIGSGKGVVAARLAHVWGFDVLPFALALKEEVLERLPRTLRVLHDNTCDCQYGEAQPAPVEACIRDMVFVRKPAGVRELLQEYGTEVRRRDCDSYWIDRWAERCARLGPLVVADDVRFGNEGDAIDSRSGLLWRIERPGTAVGAHASETTMDAWPRWDAVIQNDGSIEHLWAQVDALAQPLVRARRTA